VFASKGVRVTVTTDTDYPFRETIATRIEAERAVRFPVLLRVPAWARGATVRVGGGREEAMVAGTLHRIEREWSGTVELQVRFPMRGRVTTHYNEAVAVERGPLVYALKIGEQWTRVNADKPHRELPHGDFEVRPATPWNYGLIVPDADLAASARETPGEITSVSFAEKPIGDRPFSPEGAGVVATAKGRRLPKWDIVRGWAGEVSPADVAWADASRSPSDEPVEDLTLVPYGCTNIRVTEFPRLRT
jgi:hypothetical protein